MIDNENQDIETDLTLIYRYDNFNVYFLELVTGRYQLKFIVNLKLYFNKVILL